MDHQQAVAVSADLLQGYRVDVAGNALPAQETVDDFNVRNLGLQIRYRYELAPLSYSICGVWTWRL
jgi:hypothetical protein